MSRRRFLALAASAVAAGAAGGATAYTILGRQPPPSPARPPTLSYRSRPDLAPPQITVTTPAAGAAKGLIFLTPFGPAVRSGALIMDDRGEPVWWAPIYGPGRIRADLRVQQLRGQPVLTWWEGTFDDGNGEGEFVIADQSYREIRRVRAGSGFAADLHEFVLTPRGTALLTAYEDRVADLTSLGGGPEHAIYECVVQEIDVDTGQVLFQWRTREHVPLEHSYFPFGFKGIPNKRFDPFHLNSIDVDGDGNLLISARHTFALYKVDGRSGEIIWRLNGKASDFSIEPRARFAWQHDARLHGKGLLTVFDNADISEQSSRESRGLLLALDEATRSARLVREYVHPRGLLSTSQGNVQRVADAEVVIGWGSQPDVAEFAESGELRFHARLPTGLQSYRAYRFSWVGRPAEAPALAAAPSGAEAVDVFVSWNGATEVARWEVRAGSSPADLRTVAVSPRTGFETRLRCRTGDRQLMAIARDSRGAALGSSTLIAVSR